jgi:hypothetical protein
MPLRRTVTGSRFSIHSFITTRNDGCPEKSIKLGFRKEGSPASKQFLETLNSLERAWRGFSILMAHCGGQRRKLGKNFGEVESPLDF